MRIALDVQGGQSESRFRGIGRYSLAFARAVAAEAQARDGKHEIWLVLNGLLPMIDAIRTEFADAVAPQRVKVFSVAGPIAESDPANAWRARAAEFVREQFLANLQPDIVHVSSLFEGWVDDSTVSIGAGGLFLPAAATLYDLIPMLRPEVYLADPAIRAYYLRKLQSLKRADLLLAISNSSAAEASEELHVPPTRIATISAGIDPAFRPVDLTADDAAAIRTRYGLPRPFVLCAGAADARKNIGALIDAFGRLPPELRTTHILAIVGRMGEHEERALRAAAADLPPNAVVFTGYVPDADLVALYGLCAVLVFPSLHEGFGFPAAEAMACGAAVVASNRTSLPEIVGRSDALFDPEQPEQIASLVARVLTDEAFREELRRTGPERVRRFTWQNSARCALDAFENLHDRRPQSVVCAPVRPRLAVVSPLPPQASGIADYTAGQLRELAAYYDITCITAQAAVADDWVSANFPIFDVAWFRQHHASFDRVLYHFGNSPFHAHMFDLLERIPGVVTLHDMYLSSVLRWMAVTGGDEHGFDRAVYESHGFGGLVIEHSGTGVESIERLPCSGRVISLADGVIVHSQHALDLARRWYGELADRRFAHVPFLRSFQSNTDRAAARDRLGLDPDEFVVCSFGLVSPNKLSRRLMDAWRASGLAQDGNCRLRFVGANDGLDYGAQLKAEIERYGRGRVEITGFVSAQRYRDNLAAADAAVQLRAFSRGETSAAIFDCLWQGVPLVINAHGSAAELPSDAVVQLQDDFSNADLADALRYLRENPDAAQAQGMRGRDYVRSAFEPSLSARGYRDAIEAFAVTGRSGERRTLDKLAGLTPAPPSSADAQRVAEHLTFNRESEGPTRILFDVTNLATNDLRTGIERVSRSLLAGMVESQEGMRLEPVRATRNGYVHAYAYAANAFRLPWTPPDTAIRPRSGDVLLNTEWTPNVLAAQQPWISYAQTRGLTYVQMVFDLLPIEYPEMFPEGIAGIFAEWLRRVAETADGVICISHATETALRQWLEREAQTRSTPLRIGVCQLGADIGASLPTHGLRADGDRIVRVMSARPAFLMVGTIEPRKGHRQVLDAFDVLWEQNIDVGLVIVGKQGWMSDDTVARLETHTEAGRRLLWLRGISDEMLGHVYVCAAALIAASVNEGYGLPLVEASRYGVPILARDLPVFREVAGRHASYFRGESGSDLAEAVKHWLELRQTRGVPDSAAMAVRTWSDSARQIDRMVRGRGWNTPWKPRERTADAGRHAHAQTAADGSTLRERLRLGLKEDRRIVTGRIDEIRTIDPLTGNVVPLDDARGASGFLHVRGWAVDLHATRAASGVIVTCGESMAEAKCDLPRPDIEAHFGYADMRTSGFEALLKLERVRGSFTVNAIAIDMQAEYMARLDGGVELRMFEE